MREILFRAKHVAINKWYEGYYVKIERLHYIAVTDECFENGYRMVEIDPETICQYTGLTDKDGNKIWENDVVYSYKYVSGIDITKIEAVEFRDGHFRTDLIHNLGYCSVRQNVKVIGNIFDNPELLKGGVK